MPPEVLIEPHVMELINAPQAPESNPIWVLALFVVSLVFVFLTVRFIVKQLPSPKTSEEFVGVTKTIY